MNSSKAVIIVLLGGMSLFPLKLAFSDPAASSTPPTTTLSFPGDRLDTWHGFVRHNFTLDGCSCWVAEPAKPLPGNPWAWCMEFPDAFPDRCAEPALLSKGFYLAYMSVGNTFGSPPALKHLDAFYQAMMTKRLSKKTVLIGISRGGLYAYNWAARNPEKVSVIYGDAAVGDFKSWPGGKGKGNGSQGDWQALMQCYGFKNEAEALAYTKNPIDELAPLAWARIALIDVVGDADTTVPPAENALSVEQRYKALGGEIEVIHKPGVDHHPHGLPDPTPVVDFILKYALK
jgi:hypothetical protein